MPMPKRASVDDYFARLADVQQPHLHALRRLSLGVDAKAREELKGRTIQINDLNYYIGDSLARLERYAQAEPFLREEVRIFPHNIRARAGLAMLYRAMGRDLDSERVVEELLRMSPTPEGRAMAAQLWTMFGEPEKAQRVKLR